MNATLTYVRFYGHLRKRFGCGHRLAVKSPGEALRALCHVLPGFEKYMREHSAPGYRVLSGREDVDVKLLEFQTGRADIRIVPAVTGAGGDFGKVILGAALIAASFYLPVTPLIAGFSTSLSSIAFSVGVSMALAGVSGMIAGTPPAPAPAEAPNNQPSYAFNGAVNTSAQGNCVPLLCGLKMRVGSAVISAGLSVAQLAG